MISHEYDYKKLRVVVLDFNDTIDEGVKVPSDAELSEWFALLPHRDQLRVMAVAQLTNYKLKMPTHLKEDEPATH